MPVGPDVFKRALGQFASGVTVVTTVDGSGMPHGLTVSSFCSVSLDPPLVLVCIDNRSDAHAGLADSGRFGVSILAEEQRDVSERFAWGGDHKFDGMALVEGEGGVPLVPGALATLACRVVATHPAGDHVVYVGEVEEAEARPGAPLVYQRGAYHAIEPGRP